MAGEAQSAQFMLTSATLMLAPMADQLTINPVAHSLGLVKNVTINSDPQFVELTQGIANTVVMSVKNNNGLKVAAEVYEYTPKNLAYALGLDAAPSANFALNSATHAVNADVSPSATAVVVTGNAASTYTAGTWIYIQENIGSRDVTHIARVTSSAFSTNTTITITGFPTPAGVTFTAANARVGKINKLDLFAELDNNTFACRIVGLMARNKTPVVIHMPKVKVTKGFNLALMTDNFGNLPFELTPYQPIASDVGYSAYFPEALTLFPGA